MQFLFFLLLAQRPTSLRHKLCKIAQMTHKFLSTALTFSTWTTNHNVWSLEKPKSEVEPKFDAEKSFFWCANGNSELTSTGELHLWSERTGGAPPVNSTTDSIWCCRQIWIDSRAARQNEWWHHGNRIKSYTEIELMYIISQLWILDYCTYFLVRTTS